MLRIAMALVCLTAGSSQAGTIRYDFAASWASGDRPFLENGTASHFAAPRSGFLEFETSTQTGAQSCDIGGWMACDATYVTSFRGGVADGVANMGGQMARFSISDSGGWLTYIADTVWFADPSNGSSRQFWSAQFTLRLDPVAPPAVPLPGAAALMISALALFAGLGPRRGKAAQ